MITDVTNIPESLDVPTDVVYAFRQSDSTFDSELLYSLRSVKKNLKGYRKIWILGPEPRFSEDVCVNYERLGYGDPFPVTQKNVRSKLLKACLNSDIASNIVYMNDDFFFLQEMRSDSIPYYRQGTIQQHIEWREGQGGSHYVRALQATLSALQKQNMPTTDFEVHVPIILEKQYLSRVLGDEFFDWDATYGMTFRSLYCNLLQFRGERHMDLKIDSPMTDKELDRCFCSVPFLSTGKGGLNEAMWRHLSRDFPPG